MRGGLFAALLCVAPTGGCSTATAARPRDIHGPASSAPAASVLSAPGQATPKQTVRTEASVEPSALVVFLPHGPSRRRAN